MGDHNCSLPVGNLRQSGHLQSNFLDVSGSKVIGLNWGDCSTLDVKTNLGEGQSFVLISENNVDIGISFEERLFEELGNEGSSQIEHERLLLLMCILGDFLDGWGADSQEEPLINKCVSRKFKKKSYCNVVKLSFFDEGPVVGNVKVVDGESIGGSEMSTKRSILSIDQSRTGPGFNILVDL